MSESVVGTHHLIARHAGSALWFARYMERIENLARLLDVTKTFASEGEAGAQLALAATDQRRRRRVLREA